MHHIIVASIAAAGVVCLTPGYALSATPPVPCGSEVLLTAPLKSKYGEKVMIEMRSGGGRSVKIFSNAKTQTWSVVTIVGAIACLVGHGTGLHLPEGEILGDDS